MSFIACQLICAQPSITNPRIDSLRALLNSSQLSDSNRVQVYLDLARSIQQIDQESQESILLATKAVSIAMDEQDDVQIASSLNTLGLLYRYQQKYAESAAFHIKAYRQIEHMPGQAMLKIMCANNAGVASRYNGDYDVAVDFYLHALKLAEKEQNQLSMEIAYNGMGITFMQIPGEEKQALKFLESALEIAKASNNRRGQAMQYLSISGFYLHNEDFALARKTLDDLMQLNREMGDKHGIAMTYQQYGEVYYAENKLGMAIDQTEKALKGFEELGERLQQAQVHERLGKYHFENHDYQQSLNHHHQSMVLAEALNNRNLMMENAFHLSNVYEKLKQPDRALLFYKIAYQQKDSIDFNEQSVKIESIKRQYDIENKEKEIELLSNQQETQRAELRTKNLFLTLLSLVLLAVAIITFLQFRIRNVRKARLQAIYERNVIEAEMIASRMQINPHFLFNSLNSIKYLIQVQENDKAISYLLLLSRFLRKVLETARNPIHSMKDELELIEYYLRLESNRFENDFNFQIKNDLQNWENHQVLPALLLQPFVENAIWHGILPEECIDKRMNIHVWNDENQIHISIEDFGVGRASVNTNSSKLHKSMGHEITNKRIDLHNKRFGDCIRWEIIDKKDQDGQPKGTKVYLTVQVA